MSRSKAGRSPNQVPYASRQKNKRTSSQKPGATLAKSTIAGTATIAKNHSWQHLGPLKKLSLTTLIGTIASLVTIYVAFPDSIGQMMPGFGARQIAGIDVGITRETLEKQIHSSKRFLISKDVAISSSSGPTITTEWRYTLHDANLLAFVDNDGNSDGTVVAVDIIRRNGHTPTVSINPFKVTLGKTKFSSLQEPVRATGGACAVHIDEAVELFGGSNADHYVSAAQGALNTASYQYMCALVSRSSTGTEIGNVEKLEAKTDHFAVPVYTPSENYETQNKDLRSVITVDYIAISMPDKILSPECYSPHPQQLG